MINKTNKKTWLTSGIILLLALAGLMFINTGRGDAINMAESGAGITDGKGSETASDLSFTSNALPSILRMFSALIIVIICIYICVFLFKRFIKQKNGNRSGGNFLEVLETAYISQHKTISLIRVADKSVLVGITESSMTMLTELDKETTDGILDQEAVLGEGNSTIKFKNILSTASDRLRSLSLKKGKTAFNS